MAGSLATAFRILASVLAVIGIILVNLLFYGAIAAIVVFVSLTVAQHLGVLMVGVI